ncbi:hypothetical protein Tcan_07537 [Toxocara canis]|uniref:Chondroitin proteoglycan 4 domain-containing protein n=1 Tax=Toxocara canis TaxID=6265 RepID=A0A0B2UTM9_TOXCA|nr:hypothetical protein Tcan_07537 [Toxocara canis]
MKVKIVTVLSIFALAVDGHPAFQKQFENLVNSSPCLKKCVDDMRKSELELSIIKTVDFANYFLNLDTICNVIANAKDCFANCAVNSNPFRLRSMTVMCSPEIRQATKQFALCMEEEGKTVLSICERQCGDINAVNGEIEARTTELNSQDFIDNEKFNTIMRKTNEACRMTKCYARCSRGNYASACHHLGQEEAGEFLYAFIDTVNNAMITDVEEQKLLQTMARSSPPQCNYFYTRGVLLNKTADDVMLREIFTQMKRQMNDGKSQSLRIPTTRAELEQLQRRILLKELDLLDKRERLLEKEFHKLDMETALAATKGGF